MSSVRTELEARIAVLDEEITSLTESHRKAVSELRTSHSVELASAVSKVEADCQTAQESGQHLQNPSKSVSKIRSARLFVKKALPIE